MTNRLDEVRAIASRRAGAVLSRTHAAGKRLRFRCARGHTWEATATAVIKGDWCPTCAVATGAGRVALASLRAVVRRHGGRIESAYAGHRFPMTFRCARGHTFVTTPKSVKDGRWCRTCATANNAERQRDRSRADLEVVLEQRGGTLIGAYAGTATPARFRCAQGHEWTAAPAGILYHGHWCRICMCGIASIEDMREVAARHGGACLSRRYRSALHKLRWRCALGHEWQAIPANVVRGHWCPLCLQGTRYDIGKMRAIARQRGGRCLSREYRSVGHKLRWRCKLGHEWEQVANSIIGGSWCPICSRSGGPRPKLAIEDMHALARDNGGQCLSEDYSNVSTRLRWRCARGHEWEMAPAQMRSRGAWCPTCAYLPPNSLEGVRALAYERGGRCLSTTWNDRRRPLEFECAHGHRFALRRGALKTGVWCPQCRRKR